MMVFNFKLKYFFLLFVIIFNTLNANEVEKLAFNAYKQHNYKKALDLYKIAAREDSLKSYLMIGVFLEKGLGIKEDKNKAIKVYKAILKKAKNLNGSKEDIEKIDIAILALKRLYNLTNNQLYNNLIEKFTNIKKNILQKSTSSLNLHIDKYFQMCPSAKLVDIKDAEGINLIDCTLFQQFPERMALFMKLKKKRVAYLEKNDKSKLNSINKKIYKILKPVLKYIEQQTINCYSNATYIYELQSCDYNYLTQTDPLFFENRAYKMEKFLSKQNKNIHKIESYEKEKIINSLIYQFSMQNYNKRALHMVKLY